MPSKIASSINPPATVIVTGANGFIAQHCIAALLKQGYNVVGTVRSASKVKPVKEAHQSHDNLQLVVVDDITSPECYLKAFNNLTPSAILHLAAPFHYNASDFEKELMVPAVLGSTAILDAAAQIKTIKRVVHTNSFACIYDAAAGPSPEKTYTSKDWSPLTYEDGVNAPNAPTAYRASKTAAEKAAWNFMTEKKPGFDLVSLCPTMVFGPFLPAAKPKSIGEVNTSNLMVWSVVSAGKNESIPPTKGPCWVDVRDVADAHVKALLVPEAGGNRYMLCQSVYCNQELADVSRKVTTKYAETIPVGEPGKRESHTHYGVDASDAEKVLGLKWRGLEDCLGDLVPQLFEIGRTQVAA
ncbi:NAD(P)-binding domain-containing protein [Pochonia chlamydosporia 170]|uniref:NAD(P)-binding domain-containing protein n=1 Tax=Pochonia chlamydosporia 170 TaxID=1380566 RepID=A0A179FKF5_METCM|nr:NAD(P)-binding domain-containing protein [Pochonia chlamydosporia 170]OAQ66105.1 NAD(P)-binding domain-containing protein [Pochonia chlamydosporia 170]